MPGKYTGTNLFGTFFKKTVDSRTSVATNEGNKCKQVRFSNPKTGKQDVLESKSNVSATPET